MEQKLIDTYSNAKEKLEEGLAEAEKSGASAIETIETKIAEAFTATKEFIVDVLPL